MPEDGCHGIVGRKLLYVGISPAHRGSRANLHSRVRYHFRGNCSGSTLRTTLACLLAEHARVCWVVRERPWEVEEDVIRSLCLPLNLRHNDRHAFYPALRALRRDAVAHARRLPVLVR